MIYTVSGNTMSFVYGISGASRLYAYDVDGLRIDIQPTTIKVMTYNVGQWYTGKGDNVPLDMEETYLALQDGIIADNDADILFIEEYWKVFSKSGKTAMSILSEYYPYIHEQGGDSGYFGRCICSKYPIRDYATNYYSNDTQRYYDSCSVTVNGIPIRLVITHLGLTAEDRAPQVETLVDYLSGLDTFICAGDFNAPSGYGNSPTDTEMAEIEPFTESGFKLANCADLGNFMTGYPGTVDSTWKGWIDNICVSSGCTPVSAYVDTAKLDAQSRGDIATIDHIPFVCTVSIG